MRCCASDGQVCGGLGRAEPDARLRHSLQMRTGLEGGLLCSPQVLESKYELVLVLRQYSVKNKVFILFVTSRNRFYSNDCRKAVTHLVSIVYHAAKFGL